MYTTLLLIVLFERTVAVEFSVETQKKEAALNNPTSQVYQVFHILTTDKWKNIIPSAM